MSRRLPILALAGILAAFHVALAVHWWKVDRVVPPWDPAVHLGTALDYKEALHEGRWLDLLRTQPRAGHPQYPFVYHYSLVPLLSGDAPHRAVVFLNLLYFFVLVGSAAVLAWLAAGPWASAAALIVCAFSPGLLYKYREAFPDLSLASWTTAAYGCLALSEGFKNRRWALATGLCAGLAVLSKWGAVLYLAPAVVWGLREREGRRNLAWAVGLAAAMALPWYLINTPTMLPRIWNSVTLGHKQGQPLTWTAANWTAYLKYLYSCFGVPGVYLLLAGCVLALRRPTALRVCLAGWLGFSYLFCTLVPSKDDRYFLPAAAALPALGAAGLPLPALAVSAGLAAWHARGIRRPDPSQWPAEEMLSEVESRRKGKPASVCLLVNSSFLNSTTMSYLARRRALGGIYFGGHQTEIPEWADFVLLKTDNPGAFVSDTTQRILADERDPKSFFHAVFRLARSWPLPDGSEGRLYEQRPDLKLVTTARRFPSMEVRGSTLRGVTIKPLGPGRFLVSVDTLELHKLPAPIRGLKAELSGARLLERGGRVYVLGLDKLKLVSARQSPKELSEALSRRAGLPLSIEAQGADLRAAGRVLGIALEAVVSPRAEGSEVSVSLVSLRVGGFKLPLPAFRLTRSLTPNFPYQPYALELTGLKLTPEEFAFGA